MKFNTIALAAVGAGVALAGSHNHNHAHFHRRIARGMVTVTSTASTPGPSAFAYVLNGSPITLDEVCDGLRNNKLKFADGGGIPDICNNVPPHSNSTGSGPGQFFAQSITNSTSTGSALSVTTTSASASTTLSLVLQSGSTTSSSGSSQSTGSSSPKSGASGLTAAFPDGQLDCSSFPSQYGAVALDYLGLGGWSGLQACTIAGGAVNHIVTGISGQDCADGMFCSYACPPGYQKAHWPSTQGATGESIGGLACKNGKLYLTNPQLSTSLCIPGRGGVQAQNKAGGVVSICRTDYPGTESETVPVELSPGETEQLTNPDASSYYTWQGKSTSAQYYLNPPGYGANKACQWGSPGTPLGNYAPINFGVGYSNGKTWLSIFQNAPTTTAQYPVRVELTGDISGQCYYENGKYCSSPATCNSNGCTVAVLSGTATYVIG